MTYAYADTLEQISRQAQDEAIESIYLEGVSDGYEGIKPRYSILEYLQGYCQGMRQFALKMQRDAALLEQEGQEVEKLAIAIPF